MSDIKFKTVFTFEHFKEMEVEEPEIVKNEDGTETKTIKKTIKKLPFKFAVKKPMRSFRDDVELFRGKEYGKAIKNNLMPAALVSKRLIEDQGVFSESEKEEFDKKRARLFEVQATYAKANLIAEKDRTEEQNKEIETYLLEIQQLRYDLAKYETATLAIYDNTVEVYIRNKTIFFYTLFLSYKEDGEKWVPFFGETTGKGWEKDYENRLKKFDEYEETNDKFTNEVINKFINICTIYFVTGEDDEKELRKLVDTTTTSERVAAP